MAKQISLDLGRADRQNARINVFARHETFHPRFGWIKKGFDKVTEDPKIFGRKDAPVRLGVGKNMVRAIRYWCTAFKVLDEQDEIGPTDLGERLLAPQGWDPFLEDPASLWLLHWMLLTPPCTATAWEFAFNRFQQMEFSADDLVLALSRYLESQSVRVAESSLRKDVTCILRMYGEQTSKAGFNEDLVDCPFTELRLLYSAGEARQYEFQLGPKDNLPAALVVYACLDFASRVGSSQRTIALSRLAFDPGSPGTVFKLSESAIAEAIERLLRRTDGLVLSDTAGLIQLSFDADPAELALEVLQRYYQDRGKADAGGDSSRRAS